VVWGVFAAINYWWPKAFGFKLNEFWGKVSFWCWVPGFWIAFTPLYMLGFMGVTRRMRVFDSSFDAMRIYYWVALFGALLIAAGIGAMLVQFAVSIWKREEYKDESGDIWGGRTLEWATSSPPPEYNFAFTPKIHDIDAWADMKAKGVARPTSGFQDIYMPQGTWAGIVLAGLSTVCGFALIWQVWWLAIVMLVGIVSTAIFHTFNYNRTFYIKADHVAAVEDARTAQLAALEKGAA
jgi:cytochrome o ubiquinol oxidase subunit 1